MPYLQDANGVVAHQVVDDVGIVSNGQPTDILFFRGAPQIGPALEHANVAAYEARNHPRRLRIMLADVALDSVELGECASRVPHGHRPKRSHTAATSLSLAKRPRSASLNASSIP